MTLVAWILAIFGAGLAFAMCAGSLMRMRQVDRASAIAVMPLPALAMYFTANDLLALVQAGAPYEGIVFIGGPFVIGLVTLLGVVWAARDRGNRRDWR
jgi:predicted MFS family arabinose efflux permease